MNTNFTFKDLLLWRPDSKICKRKQVFTGRYSKIISNVIFVPINGIMVLENIGLNEGILLKQTCKKCGISVFSAFCGSRYGPVTSPCEHGNQRQGCTIVAQILERINPTIRYMRISSNTTMCIRRYDIYYM